MDIGFIGLGRMGRHMAANLVKAGHRVRVWNRSPDAAKGIGGAEPVATAAEAFRGEAAITMLADDAALRAVIVEGGLLDAPERPGMHIGMSTISVGLAQDLAAIHGRAGVPYVSAPVFGPPKAAEAGALNVVAAGDAAAIAKAQPLFEAMGSKTWEFGPEPHRANAVKLAGNFMLLAAIEAMGEAKALVEGHGVDGNAALELYTSTLFACPVYKNYGGTIMSGRYEPPGFTVRLGAKDMRLALAAGESAGVPMPLGSVVRDSFIESISHGDGDKDIAAASLVAARRSGQT